MKSRNIKYPNLVAEMARRGVNQTMLADLLDLKQGTVSRKLSGLSEWSIDEIDKLCEHFHKDYYHLFK